MKFDPLIWTLRVGRRWRYSHERYVLIFEETASTFFDLTTRELKNLKCLSLPPRELLRDVKCSHLDDGRRVGPMTRKEFSQMSKLDREWLIFSTIQSLLEEINMEKEVIHDQEEDAQQPEQSEETGTPAQTDEPSEAASE